MDYKAIIEEVIQKSSPREPICSVCNGKMLVSEINAHFLAYVCSKVKPTNNKADTRLFDPGHYDRSRTLIPNGVDLSLLRDNLFEAFGKVEAETEKRIREELKRTEKAQKKASPKLLLDEKVDVNEAEKRIHEEI